MSNAYTSAGTRIFISEDLPLELGIDDFESLPYQEIGAVSDIAEFGRSTEVLSYYEMGSDEPVKVKGNKSFNGMSLTMAATRENQLLLAAFGSDNSYSFRIEVPEPDAYYFTAKVVEYNVNIGGADQIVSSTATLAITSDIIVDEDFFAFN